MIKAAERLSQITEYYFSKKLQEIANLRQSGLDIINLGIGNPDQMPPESALQTLKMEVVKQDAHGYQPYRGITQFRQTIADWYKRIYGIRLNPGAEILPLLGSKEGILHISMAFLNIGDVALIPDPSYPAYSAVTKMIGAIPEYFPLIPEKNWQPDFSELQRRDLSRVKLLWLNYPNMPTGVPATEQLFKDAVEFGLRNDILICHDNPYSMILNDRPMSLLSVKGAKATAIELNSLSKSYNMAGWRIGMAISDERKIQYVQTIKSNSDSGMFKPLQIAAEAALRTLPAWNQKLNREYQLRQQIAFKILDALKCSYGKPQAGLFVWAHIPSDFQNSELFSDYVLSSHRTFLCPGHIFGKSGEKYIRLSLCNPQYILQEVLKRIDHQRN